MVLESMKMIITRRNKAREREEEKVKMNEQGEMRRVEKGEKKTKIKSSMEEQKKRNEQGVTEE